jgi:hypothetical protein
VALLYGCSEVVRSSLLLVEAAFDGDLEELKGWVDKGYHIGKVTSYGDININTLMIWKN